MAQRKNKKYKVGYLSGSRSEFGYLKRPLQELNQLQNVEVFVIATGTHTASKFGRTLSEVTSSGLRVISLYDGTDGMTLTSMARTLAVHIREVTRILMKEKPDAVIVEGDRIEQLGMAIPASILNIPILHRGGGNVSGSIDNKIRWVLSTLADYHFPSHRALGKELEKHAVPKERIINIGGVVPDAIVQKEFLGKRACRKQFRIQTHPLLILAFHPNTEKYTETQSQIDEVLAAIASLGYETIAVGANADAGGARINKRLRAFARTHPSFQFHVNLPRHKYLGLLNIADVLVGNTSSGFSELPSFKKPYVLVGERQEKRFGEKRHIIHVPAKQGAVRRAIVYALTNKKFRAGLRHLTNPYGSGHFWRRFPREVLKILQKESR